MRRKLGIAALLTLIGVVTLRFLRGRRPLPEAEPAPDPRAEELRRTLEEARRAAPTAAAPAAEDAPAATTAEELPTAAPAVDVDAERRRVHERARRAVEEMQADGDPSAP